MQDHANRPALVLGQRACLLDEDPVAHVAGVGLVVGLQLLGHADDALVTRMAVHPLDPHHARLQHGVAHDDAFSRLALAHRSIPSLSSSASSPPPLPPWPPAWSASSPTWRPWPPAWAPRQPASARPPRRRPPASHPARE